MKSKYSILKVIVLILTVALKSSFAQDTRKLSAHDDNINSIAFSNDARNFVSGGSDGKVIVWNAESGSKVNTFNMGGIVTCVAYSPDNKLIGVSILEGSAVLIDAETGALVHKFEFGPKFTSISFSNDNNYIAATHFKSTALVKNNQSGQSVDYKKFQFYTNLYSAKDYRLVKTFTIYEEDVLMGVFMFGGDAFKTYRASMFNCAFTVDSKYLATAKPDGHIAIYSFDRNDFIRDFTGHDKKVNCVTFSPDKNYLASGSNDDNLKIWNISTGKNIKTLKGHSSAVNSLAFSPDSKYIVSASDDGTAKIWNISDGKKIKTFKDHKDEVYSVGFSPDGKYIVSGGDDGKIVINNVQSLLPELKLFTAKFEATTGISSKLLEEKEAELKNVQSEYFKPKDEFETTDEYNRRLEEGRLKNQEIENKYDQKLEEKISSKEQEVNILSNEKQMNDENKIAGSVRDTILRITKIGKYNADANTFEVTIKGKKGIIIVPRKDAPTLKDYYKKADVRSKKKLSNNLNYYIYYDKVVVHPVTKSEYAVDDGEIVGNKKNTESPVDTDSETKDENSKNSEGSGNNVSIISEATNGEFTAMEGNYVVKGCEFETAGYSSKITDMNKDGNPEVIITLHSGCMGGNTGDYSYIYIKNKNGVWEMQVEDIGTPIELESSVQNWPEIYFSKAGHDYNLYKWNGEKYVFDRMHSPYN
ncbi:MAG: WD40 repeat domain-containing protein [Ignavibacteria bacterium]